MRQVFEASRYAHEQGRSRRKIARALACTTCSATGSVISAAARNLGERSLDHSRRMAGDDHAVVVSPRRLERPEAYGIARVAPPELARLPMAPPVCITVFSPTCRACCA